jgi:hypothetical protein
LGVRSIIWDSDIASGMGSGFWVRVQRRRQGA